MGSACSFALRRGDVLSFRQAAEGVQGYLALAGGLESGRFWGSAPSGAGGIRLRSGCWRELTATRPGPRPAAARTAVQPGGPASPSLCSTTGGVSGYTKPALVHPAGPAAPRTAGTLCGEPQRQQLAVVSVMGQPLALDRCPSHHPDGGCWVTPGPTAKASTPSSGPSCCLKGAAPEPKRCCKKLFASLSLRVIRQYQRGALPRGVGLGRAKG